MFSYVVSCKNTKVGTIWRPDLLNRKVVIVLGSYINLFKVVEGMTLYNVEIMLGCGGQFARSAGTSLKVLSRFINKYNKILVKLRSGDEYLINGNCLANLGTVNNSDFWLRDLKKAGVKRYYGFRSSVRGVAMNPVDHPHGVILQVEN